MRLEIEDRTTNGDLGACELFHGLRARPFSLTPDLRFTYHSRSHTHAVEEISQALKRREGLVVVTGEAGTGKTMLCRTLLEAFEPRTFLSVIVDPLMTVEELLYQVLTDFGLVGAAERPGTRVPMTEVGRHDLVATLHRFLASLIPLDAHAVIMIDEAQHLTGPVLEQVRLLSNFETDTAKLLQIVLVGQPNLDDLLERPDMRQLNQRVARRCELQPLTDTEVHAYIERRLLVARRAPEDGAGGKATESEAPDDEASVTFTDAAMVMVAAISKGIPRVVNTLCDRALEASYERSERIVDRKAVRLAATQLKLAVPASETTRRLLRLTAAATFVLAATVGVVWWVTRAPVEAPARISPPAVAPAADPAAPPAPQEPTPPAVPPQASSALQSDQPTAAPALAARYEITAASFRTQQSAAEAAATLAPSGLPVSSRLDASGDWYRVMVGPFASAADARAAQATLATLGFPGSRVSGP